MAIRTRGNINASTVNKTTTVYVPMFLFNTSLSLPVFQDSLIRSQFLHSEYVKLRNLPLRIACIVSEQVRSFLVK